MTGCCRAGSCLANCGTVNRSYRPAPRETLSHETQRRHFRRAHRLHAGVGRFARPRPDAGRVCPDGRLRGRPPEQGRRIRRQGRSSSSLGATNSGLKVLLHVGGSVPDVLGCIKYVKSCRDSTGGFAPTPGGKPDVITTAVGLMAASELKIADADHDQGGDRLLSARTPRASRKSGWPSPASRPCMAPRPTSRGGSSRSRRMREPGRNLRRGAGPGLRDRRRGRGDLADGAEARKTRRDHRARSRPASGPKAAGPRTTGRPDLGATYRVMRALFMLQREARRRSIARRSSPAAASPTAATPASPAAPATWAARTRPRSSSAGLACLPAHAAGRRDGRLHRRSSTART